MKKRNIFLMASVGILALASSSCTKNGFDFKDGYQKGDSIASPVLSDTSMGKVDKSLYAKARIYPGLVGDNVKRIADTTISILMNRDYVSMADYKVQATPGPIYSTGLYAPAGEVIRITVPEGIVGLTVQLGVHMDNIAGKDAPRRDAVIYTKKELFPGNNYVRNLYGGSVWIFSTKVSATPVTLKVSGAVKATDFTLGKSNVADWQKQVIANDVPWMDLIGKRTVFSVPRSLVVKFIQSGRMDHVDEALQLWDKTYEDTYYDWMGLSPNAAEKKNQYPQFWERGVMDIHPSLGYAHSSNGSLPWVMQEDEYWLDELTNPTTIKRGTSWGTYHEVGHNYQATKAWSWNDLGETTNNLFIFNAARKRGVTNRIDFHPALKTDIPGALAFAKLTTSKSFSNFPKEYVMSEEAAFARITPFLQIFDKVKGAKGESGWDFFPYIYSKARNENFTTSLDQAKRDYFYRQLCHFAGTDFNRFFIAWGIPVSASAKREIRNLYPPMNKALWEYNPLTYTGGDAALSAKYYLPSAGFTFTSNVSIQTGGADGGGFTALTDGNISTYLHTCYSGCAIATTSPVEIVMDMKGSNAFKGVSIQNRQTGTYQSKVRILVSTDNKNWTEMGTYTLATSTETTAQKNAVRELVFPKVVEAQYVKLVFPDKTVAATPESHVALAEVGVFYDI